MAETQLVSDATVGRIAKSIVDLGIPGFSCYLDGDFTAGLAHTVAGLGASIVLGGPIGMWLVAANSISRSSTGRNLWERELSDREHREEVHTTARAGRTGRSEQGTGVSTS